MASLNSKVPKMKEKSAAEILSGALEIWGPDGHGWVKGMLYNEDHSKFCLYGGLSKSASGYCHYERDWDRHGEYAKAIGYVQKRVGGRDLAMFNDRKSTSFKEVKEAVCGALKDALDDELKVSTKKENKK